MIKKTTFSTITAVIATIALVVTMGAIGGAGQQIASAKILDIDDLNNLIRQGIVDDRDSSGTDTSIIIVPDIALATDVVDDRVDESTNNLDVTSVFTKQEEDMDPPIAEDLLANILEDVDAVAIGGPVACCDPDCLRLVPNC
jgi:hypothetical protein